MSNANAKLHVRTWGRGGGGPQPISNANANARACFFCLLCFLLFASSSCRAAGADVRRTSYVVFVPPEFFVCLCLLELGGRRLGGRCWGLGPPGPPVGGGAEQHFGLWTRVVVFEEVWDRRAGKKQNRRTPPPCICQIPDPPNHQPTFFSCLFF
jgi:hypothetical protein